MWVVCVKILLCGLLCVRVGSLFVVRVCVCDPLGVGLLAFYVVVVLFVLQLLTQIRRPVQATTATAATVATIVAAKPLCRAGAALQPSSPHTSQKVTLPLPDLMILLRWKLQ